MLKLANFLLNKKLEYLNKKNLYGTDAVFGMA